MFHLPDGDPGGLENCSSSPAASTNSSVMLSTASSSSSSSSTSRRTIVLPVTRVWQASRIRGKTDVYQFYEVVGAKPHFS
jgi:hypothetical protein